MRDLIRETAVDALFLLGLILGSSIGAAVSTVLLIAVGALA